MVAQGFDPGDEAVREQRRRQGVHHVVQRVVRGNSPLEGQEPAQKLQFPAAPPLDLGEILGAGQRPAQDDQQDLLKRIDHLPGLPRIIEGGEVIEKGRAGHGKPR
mgnify:CR=1 FL=1